VDSDLRRLPVSREDPAGRIVYRDGRRALVLRPTLVTDADAIAAAVAASLPELRPFMPWAHRDNSPRAQLERLKKAEADYRAGRELQMALADEATGELLTFVGLHPRIALNPSGFEVGYWTPTPHANRGFATLATRIAIVYAIELLDCARVQIMHDEANPSSRRVVEKCGFRFEGTMRNAIAAPSADLVASGYRATSLTRLYGLVPEDRASLDWYVPTLRALTVENLAGHPVPLAGLPR
jgi:RimJ/RimL family protein N-acetyltransferase